MFDRREASFVALPTVQRIGVAINKSGVSWLRHALRRGRAAASRMEGWFRVVGFAWNVQSNYGPLMAYRRLL
jgi:hypothetical protein